MLEQVQSRAADRIRAGNAMRSTLADPILATIERHTLAFRVFLMTCRIRCRTVDVTWAKGYDPVECKANEDDYVAALSVANHAAYALTKVQPTTLAGVLALVRHVDGFNTGAFFLDPDSPKETVDDYKSSPIHWPETDGEDGVVDVFGHSVLANVRRALEALVQS